MSGIPMVLNVSEPEFGSADAIVIARSDKHGTIGPFIVSWEQSFMLSKMSMP